VIGVDPAPEAAAFAREQGLDHAADLQSALARGDLEAVVLATPHSLHTDQIVAAANAGKHVFCEKPLSLTRADVLRAIDAVERNRRVIAVGHERRFEPPVVELMRLAQSGALGRVLQIEANFSQDKFLTMPPDNWRLTQREAPAGPLTATGIHLVDLAVAFLGPAESAFASVKQLDSPLANGDTLAVMLKFRGGGHALLSAILATPFDGRIAVYGSKGWAEVRDKAHPEAPEGWTLTTCLRGEPKRVLDYPPAAAVLANLEAFADAIEGRGDYPVPREQMIATVSALEAIVRATRSGQVEAVA
jgi:predicted dehydrogenase